MGPLYRFRNEDHLQLFVEYLVEDGISVSEVDRTGFYLFRSRFGAVSAGPWPDQCELVLYFGCEHAFNPIFWLADSRLLRRIGRVFSAHELDPITLSSLDSK